MAKASKRPKRKPSPKPALAVAPPPAPSVAPSSPDRSGLFIRLAVVAAVGILLWWNITPPAKRKALARSVTQGGGAPSAPAGPELKGAPNTMQELVFDIGGAKTVRGSTGWGGIPKKDEAIMGGYLTMNKVIYKTGIGTHASSEIVFDLKGKYTRFSCIGGVDDRAEDSASFFLVVKAGDKKLFQSKLFKKGTLPVPINLDVTGVKELSLVVDPNGDPNWDQADWADIKFKKAGAAAEPAAAEPAAATAPAAAATPAVQ